MLKNLGYKILIKLAGKKKYQVLFEALHLLSLKGMNVGTGLGFADSGERVAAEILNKRLKAVKSPVIFDVGANTGQYSIMLQQIFGENAKIFSFEPSKKTFEQLFANTALLKNINRFNFGFGSKEAKLMLYKDCEVSSLASVYPRKLDHFDIRMDQTEEVEIKTIDSFCAENNINHINFLKLDVEGHELNVLKGASNIIQSGNIDFIQFEFGGCNIDSKTFFQDFFYILHKQYNIYRILKDGLFKIDRYKETYEAFITTNYLAERIKE